MPEFEVPVNRGVITCTLPGEGVIVLRKVADDITWGHTIVETGYAYLNGIRMAVVLGNTMVFKGWWPVQNMDVMETRRLKKKGLMK